MKNLYQMPCNIAQTLNILGDKWTLLILFQILNGRETFRDIEERLDGIPSNLLSERLKALEEEGLLTTELYQKHPPRNRYLLTESGRDLDSIFSSLMIWGDKHLSNCHKYLSHKDCGGRITQRYYCQECDEIVDKEQVSIMEEID